MLKKRLLHLSNRTTRPVITAPSPSSIYPSLQHSLPTSGSIPDSPVSLLALPSSSLAVCVLFSALPSPPLHLSLPFPYSALSLSLSIHSSSTLSISASLSAHAPSDLCSNEPPLWRQWKSPFITIFFWLHYFPVHHRVVFFPK